MAMNNKDNMTERIDDALKQLISLSPQRKFIESVDLCIKVGIDPRQTNQKVKGNTLLPYGHGKRHDVALFTNKGQRDIELPDKYTIQSGGQELVEIVSKQKFSLVLSTEDGLKHVSVLSRQLGSKGLMPTTKNGTVLADDSDLSQKVADITKNYVQFKNDSSSFIHLPIGTLTMSQDHLTANILHVLQELQTLKPKQSKGKFIRRIQISTSMGSCVQV